MSDRWAKAGVIFGGLGVILAAGAFFPQEVRCLFGIKSEVCASQSTGIKSDAGANYQKLQNYLASGDFQAANSETRKLMLWIARSEESLNREGIDQFFLHRSPQY